MGRPIQWRCSETVAIGLTNIAPVARRKLSPGEILNLERKASTAGLSVDEYLEGFDSLTELIAELQKD